MRYLSHCKGSQIKIIYKLPLVGRWIDEVSFRFYGLDKLYADVLTVKSTNIRGLMSNPPKQRESFVYQGRSVYKHCIVKQCF